MKPKDTFPMLLKVDGTTSRVMPASGKQFTAEELQKLVGGYIEIVRLNYLKYRWMILDEDGKSKNPNVNGTATRILHASGGHPSDFVVGDVVLIPHGYIS